MKRSLLLVTHDSATEELDVDYEGAPDGSSSIVAAVIIEIAQTLSPDKTPQTILRISNELIEETKTLINEAIPEAAARQVQTKHMQGN